MPNGAILYTFTGIQVRTRQCCDAAGGQDEGHPVGKRTCSSSSLLRILHNPEHRLRIRILRILRIFNFHKFLRILKCHRILKIKFAVMKLKNFLDLQTYKQN